AAPLPADRRIAGRASRLSRWHARRDRDARACQRLHARRARSACAPFRAAAPGGMTHVVDPRRRRALAALGAAGLLGLPACTSLRGSGRPRVVVVGGGYGGAT